MAQVGAVNAPDGHRAFLVFAACWIPLGIASFLFFYFNRNAALKRKVFPIFATVAAILFGAFAISMLRGSLLALVTVVPMIAVITFLNIRMVRFCEACGRTLIQQSVFRPSNFCSHCGKALK